MNCRLTLTAKLRLALIERLHEAYEWGQLRLIKRIHALLDLADGKTFPEVAERFQLSAQTLRNYVTALILKGLDSLTYQRPPGRPAKLTKTQHKELGDLLDAGPEQAGYDVGGWNTVLIQDVILTKFGVEYTPHYVAELLDVLGFSWQKARFQSDHLEGVALAQQEWMTKTWPEIQALAKQKQAMILFGDEASFAQWGSLSYTWARKGHQPTVKTSGKRKAYKVFGVIDLFSGALFTQGHTGKFNSDSYQAFLLQVLAKTKGHLILIQDGARYHTSKAMQAFFAQHAERLTVYPLPAYSPNFNPIEYLWRKLKRAATHLRYFPTFEALVQKVEEKLQLFATLPDEILALMGKYCESLGTQAA